MERQLDRSWLELFNVLFHLGVAQEALDFQIEMCAYNEAHFWCSDEKGYAPMCRNTCWFVCNYTHYYSLRKFQCFHMRDYYFESIHTDTDNDADEDMIDNGCNVVE